jgi:hypothetical protein
MSTDRETTPLVRSWLEDGVTRLPDRVLDAVLDQLPATPQRRSWWPAWRSTPMNGYAKLAIAAAAVVAAALVAFRFLPSNGPPGGHVSPAPSPTLVMPTAHPAQAPRLPSGPLEAGTYSLDPGLGITMDVPDGWEGCCGTPAWAVLSGEIVPTGAAIAYEDVTDITVHGESCLWRSSTKVEPRGAEAVAAALASQAGPETSEPREVTVGGLPGFHVRLTVPDDLEIAVQSDGDHTFVDCDGGEFQIYETPPGARYLQGLSQTDDFYIVDIGSRTVLFDVSYFPDTAAPDRAAVEAMLASVQIE